MRDCRGNRTRYKVRSSFPRASPASNADIAAAGRPEAVNHVSSRNPAGADGGRDAQQRVPALGDGPPRNGFSRDWPQPRWDTSRPRGKVKLAVFQAGQPRAQVEAGQLGKCHGEMREAVGVDRDPLKIHEVLTQSALNGGAGLPVVEDDGLIINDPPLVEHMGVGSGGIGAPPWVDTGRPEMMSGLQAHHVGRGMEPLTPA